MTDTFFEVVGTSKKAGHGSVSRANDIQPACADMAVQTLKATGANSRRSWAEADGTFWGVQKASAELPCGIYRVDVNMNMGPVFMQQKNDTDELVALPDSESQKILDEIKVFKTLRPSFKKHGFLYKRGILMWGPPGSGKTSTLQQLIKLLITYHNSIAVLIDNPGTAATCLQALRNIEPDRQIVAILEDLDALTERYGESEYLSLLDGESQVDNIVYVATTNYPERLDSRFVDRPSRFDTVRYIGMPNNDARRTYLETKDPEMEAEDLKEMVRLTDGFSIAHLRELIILTRCFNKPRAEAIERLRKSITSKLSSDKSPDRAGFGFGQ